LEVGFIEVVVECFDLLLEGIELFLFFIEEGLIVGKVILLIGELESGEGELGDFVF
jgi:hypothetical protein